MISQDSSRCNSLRCKELCTLPRAITRSNTVVVSSFVCFALPHKTKHKQQASLTKLQFYAVVHLPPSIIIKFVLGMDNVTRTIKRHTFRKTTALISTQVHPHSCSCNVIVVFVIYCALNLIRHHGTGKGKKQCFLTTVNFNEGTKSASNR